MTENGRRPAVSFGFQHCLFNATKTGETQKTAPGQFVQVGIAEGNMAGIAAGMAVSGLKPFASSFAMFLAGRAYAGP